MATAGASLATDIYGRFGIVERVSLPGRVRQVCAHALGGVTMAGIASMLGVKESTVATLRRRADPAR